MASPFWVCMGYSLAVIEFIIIVVVIVIIINIIENVN
jgi:hypothetical protein